MLLTKKKKPKRRHSTSISTVFSSRWTNIFWLQSLSYLTMFFLIIVLKPQLALKVSDHESVNRRAVFPARDWSCKPTLFVILGVCGPTFSSVSDTIRAKSKCYYFIIKKILPTRWKDTVLPGGKHPTPQSRLKERQTLGAQRNWDPGGRSGRKIDTVRVNRVNKA